MGPFPSTTSYRFTRTKTQDRLRIHQQSQPRSPSNPPKGETKGMCWCAGGWREGSSCNTVQHLAGKGQLDLSVCQHH